MKRIILFLFLGLFTLTTLAQDKIATAQKAIDKKDYKTAYTIAKELLDAKDGVGASRLLLQLRAVNYSDPKFNEYLGDAYSLQGVAELAVINYEEAERSDSLNVELKFKTADILLKQQRYTDAVNKYLKIQGIDPKNSKAYLDAGNILFRAKYYADAGKMYEEYLKLEKSQEAYENITKSFYEAKNWDKAYEFGIKSLELYGENPQLSKYVANSSLMLKKYEDAAKYFSQVPDSLLNVNELERVGRAFQVVNDNNTAMKYFEKVIKMDSTRSSIYFDLGNNFYREKKFEDALKYYTAKAQADSTFEPAYRFMGYANYQLNKFEDARVNLLKSISMNPKEINTYYFLAQTYKGLDSLDRAGDTFKDILDLIGNDEAENKDKVLEANAFLASRMMNKKAYSGAIQYLVKVEKLKPSLDVYRMLASCYLSAGNNDMAISYAKRVLKGNPNDADMKKILRVLSAD